MTILTSSEIRAGFDALAANLRAAGHLDAAARAELLREWFANPGFRGTLATFLRATLA